MNVVTLRKQVTTLGKQFLIRNTRIELNRSGNIIIELNSNYLDSAKFFKRIVQNFPKFCKIISDLTEFA